MPRPVLCTFPRASGADFLRHPKRAELLVSVVVCEDLAPVFVKLRGDVVRVGNNGTIVCLERSEAVCAAGLEFANAFLYLSS